MPVLNTTDKNFKNDVLDSSKPVLVDFWAEWCGPCKMIAPVLDQLAGDYDGQLKICKMDVDSNKETPAKYGIRGIPTLMIFKNGAMEDQTVGALSKPDLEAFIKKNI